MPLGSLKAADIMTRALICARSDQDLAEVERMLIDRRVTGLPVVDGGELVGVISRSDIARVEVLMQSLDGQVTDESDWDARQADGFQHPERPEYTGFRRLVDRLKVKDAMRDQVITCQRDTPVRDVAAAMIREHIHRIIVVDAAQPVGIISSLDIVRLVAERADEGQPAAPTTSPRGA